MSTASYHRWLIPHPCLETPRDGGQESCSCHRFHTPATHSFCFARHPRDYATPYQLYAKYRLKVVLCQVSCGTLLASKVCPRVCPFRMIRSECPLCANCVKERSSARRSSAN